jgi:AcrR family transcriptional regulator
MKRIWHKQKIRTYSDDDALVEERRWKIVSSATRLFNKNGFHNTNMRTLAKACKMSVGSIYYYVGTKEDILRLIAYHARLRPDNIRNDYVKRCTAHSAKQVLKEFIDEYYRNLDNMQDNCIFTYNATKFLDPVTRQSILDAAEGDINICAEILNIGVKNGEFKPHDTVIMAHNILSLSHMWAVRRWFLQKRYNIDTYIKEQTRFSLDSIDPGKPLKTRRSVK